MATKRELVDDEIQSSQQKKLALDPSICKPEDDENLINDIFNIDIVKEDVDSENVDGKTNQDICKDPLQPDSTEDTASTSPTYAIIKIEPHFPFREMFSIPASVPSTSNELTVTMDPEHSQTQTADEFSIMDSQAGPSELLTSTVPAEEIDSSSVDPDVMAAELQVMIKYPSHSVPSHHRRKANSLRCVVESLLEFPFASEKWSDLERQELIKHGKPEIKLSDFEISTRSEEFTMPDNFLRKVHWMTGCLKLQILVCWPCLIAGDAGPWATGFSPTAQLMQESIHHNSTDAHLTNVETVVNLTKHYLLIAQPNQVSTTQAKSKNYDLIEKLITHPFSQGSGLSKRRIILNGKPTPEIPDFKYAHFQKNRTYVRSFNMEHYSNIPWLTGSATQKKLFCWPCVLFNQQGTWGKTGFNNLSNLSATVARHEVTLDHLTASVLLKAHEARLRNEQPVVSKQHVQNQQHLLKCLTDAVCYVKTCGPIHSQDDYLELMEFMGRTDPKVDALLVGHKAEINNYAQHLSIAIEEYLKAGLNQELDKATFVSLIFGEVPSKDDTTHIAFIVRYVNEGGVIKERFVTYITILPETSSADIIRDVSKLIVNLQIAPRVVGYTCDGCFTNYVDMTEFHLEIKKLCSHSYFFPHKDFTLMHTVEQALSRIVEVRDFFHLLSKINRFSIRQKSALLEIDKELAEKLSKETNRIFDLVLILAKNYAAILRLFKTVANKVKSWPNRDILEARTFVDMLLTIQCRFKIILLQEVMPALTKLSDDFRSDLKFHRWGVSTMQFYSDVLAIKNAGWSGILSRAITLNGETEVCVDEAISNNFVVWFEQTIDIITQMALDRSSELDFFAYYDIVCNEKYRPKKESTVLKISVLAEKFRPIMSFWPSLDPRRLIGFLNFALWEGHIVGVTLLHKFNTIRSQRLVDTLPDLYTFLKLIFTIPMVRMDDVSAIKQLRKYAKERHQLDVRDTFLWTQREQLAVNNRDGKFYREIRDYFWKMKSMNMNVVFTG